MGDIEIFMKKMCFLGVFMCVCFFLSKMLVPPHHLGVPNIFINEGCLFVVLRFPNERVPVVAHLINHSKVNA